MVNLWGKGQRKPSKHQQKLEPEKLVRNDNGLCVREKLRGKNKANGKTGEAEGCTRPRQGCLKKNTKIRAIVQWVEHLPCKYSIPGITFEHPNITRSNLEVTPEPCQV